MKVWVGDPCLVLTEDQYDTLLDRYEDGEVDMGEFTCIVYSTGGDGFFRDQNDKEYIVDSGQLCVIPLDFVTPRESHYLSCGNVHDDKEWVNGWYETSSDDVSITFGDVNIRLGWGDEDDDD